ncbi:PfkB family carbohydrate kinase [Kribbella sp. NPDC059898]|uniref:PfkB family carbohydrate kinase n=1 Tax=Kribbella sp. NPDC059898 TaxID=3346995 RepID=UPI0036589D33
MSDLVIQGPSNGSYLVPVFNLLRKNDGLTAKRVANLDDAQELLRLPIVQNKAIRTGQKPAEAAVSVIIEQVAELDSPTDRIIADGILRLGIYLDRYKAKRVPALAVSNLAHSKVGTRRLALVNHWTKLHEALAEEPPAGPSPGEHTLRARLERQVFERLSALLVNPRSGAEPAATAPPLRRSRAQTVDAAAAGKVIVVGGAAIDHTWRIGSTPAAGTSERAMTFTRTPGGKGVSQAVAAAHLDLDVSLIAAVATDEDGREIVAHLDSEGVDTSLLHRVERPGARTPVTGIFELPYGDSSAAVWRDGIELDTAAVEQHADTLAACDVVLVTFELPQPVLKRVLDLIAGADDPPVVIVTPGQPYGKSDTRLVSPLLKQMDYLVAHQWELERFAFTEEAKYDPELLSDDLLSRGLRSLCLLVPDGGSIYERGKAPAQLPRPHRAIAEAAISRDAFCAALAARLIEDHTRTDNTYLWAAASMASFAESYREDPTAHPTRDKIESQFSTMRQAGH